MPRSIPHTIIRNGIYWLNLHTQQGRLRLSLGTREPLQAMHLAGGVVRHLRSSMVDYSNLKKLKLLAQRWLEEKTLEAEWMLAQLGKYNPLDSLKISIDGAAGVSGMSTYRAVIDRMNKDHKQALLKLHLGPFNDEADEATALLADAGLTDQEPAAVAYLCRELAAARAELLRRAVEHDTRWLSSSPPLSEPVSTEPLGEQWEKWIALKIKSGQLKERSESRYRTAYARFAEVMGELRCDQLNKDVARRYRDALNDYPSQRNKGAKRAAMTLEQVKEIEPKRLDTTTIKDDIETLSGFVKWLLREGLINSNPIEGMAPSVNKAEKSRDPFTIEELQQIFSHSWFRGEHATNRSTPLQPWQYWVPILGLFTGARLEEICRLRR